MEAARIRNGKITLKGGARLSIFPTSDATRGYMERHIHEVFDGHGDDLAGIAIVVWGSDNASTCYSGIGDGKNQIPSILIPDFVRNRLLAERIEKWTLATINGESP